MFANRYMPINNDYIVIPFVVNNEDKNNYIVKINRNNNTFSYNKMPDMFDNMNFWDGYFYNGTLYFRMWDENPDVIPYTTSDFENFTMITTEEFWAVGESKPVYYYSDSKNRLYDIEDNSISRTETYLCVSIDNGNTWYKGNMGTNYANRVTSVGDTIYVSCHSYYEVIGFFPIGSTGGGLHVFQWEYE